eukprot:CAMPEP_0117543622 /NCGR_PEP_ID=MMETSP0784-20121206/45154_1 /TAXON_ID=39447 /ORGANISM="" /LENGTH=111 /DNA_ID=CAMNT_0005340403 /DNA_START=68 /DNA_END=403 /DNA_ORIENTATION=-
MGSSRRNAGSLLAIAVFAAVAWMLVGPSQESFLAPARHATPPSETPAGSPLAHGFKAGIATRSTSVAMQAQQGGQPNRINLLFLATLVGTAAIGLIAILGYGAYSGTGSSL